MTMTESQALRVVREETGPAAGVFTVLLEQPGKPVVVLDQELIQRLESALKTIPANAAGLVLASPCTELMMVPSAWNVVRSLAPVPGRLSSRQRGCAECASAPRRRRRTGGALERAVERRF